MLSNRNTVSTPYIRERPVSLAPVLCQRLSGYFQASHHRNHIRLPATVRRLKRCVMKHMLASAILLATSLSACTATKGEFPSLQKRPFEGAALEQPTEITTNSLAETLPAPLAAKIASIQARHNASASAYADLLPAARNAARAAAGSGAGNENWVAAHVTLGRLDKSRADSVAALAELDALVISQEDIEFRGGEFKGSVPSVLHLLTPVQAKIAEAVASQNSEISRLSLLIGHF